MSFEPALKTVLKAEAGYNDDPADHGGATNKGITQRVYDAYRQRLDVPVQSVAFISGSEVSSIYRLEYWDAVHADELPEPVDMVMFDSAVNCGVRQSAKWLQRAVSVRDDGVIGKVTLKAVQALDPIETAESVLNQRHDFYNDLVDADPVQQRFLRGWLNRIASLRQRIRSTQELA